MTAVSETRSQPKVAFWNDRKFRSIAVQLILLIVVVLVAALSAGATRPKA